jgi:hypothetical protein
MAPSTDSSPVVENAAVPTRLTVSIPYRQNAALDEMAEATGLSKPDLLRHAVALLNVAYRARSKELDVAIINSDDKVVAHIAQTF